jgi:dynein heavy chain, axonemal
MQGELYGEENSETREWTDGLASLLMRKAAKKQTHNKNWIIFDGPVDSLWIENLNTVLDDNMTLCLSNGERVKLRHEMRILFEVQDLSEASPATVSRCGMVYMTPSDLGWEPFIQSWIPAKFSDENILDKELIAYLQNLIQDSVEKGIKLLRKLKDYEPIKTCGIQCVSNLCNMLEYYLSPHFGFKKSVSFETKRKRLLTFFCFAYAWSFGGSLNTAAHIQVNHIYFSHS